MIVQTDSLSEAIKVPTNPFPGLRPFEFEESQLFFGRDSQIEKLIDKLKGSRFLAVVGTSGSGKSSLVRAGFLPALLGGLMTEAGTKWRLAVMRPGNDPIRALATALNEPKVFGSDDPQNVAIQVAVTEATFRRGSRGLVEVVQQNALPSDENVLVVVDQFEELFRFAREAARKAKEEGERYQNDAAAFVKLLLQARAQRDVNIYVVLTMRSDFLGQCATFWDLPEAVNESQYLIPRLTRDQLREVIVGPIGLARGDISPRLLTQLLNDIGVDQKQDQLPVLQHLLMRIWDESKELLLDVEEGNRKIPHRELHKAVGVDICCYNAVGGMSAALSRHADEAYDELPDERHRLVAKKLFKALTEKGVDNLEIRRPITVSEICETANASQAEVVKVIEAFRQPGRSFLMPPHNVPLTDDTLIDISHESLIRRWTRLDEWTKEEATSARIYRRLAETAVLEAEGGAGLWRDPDLQVALEWREQTQPNKVWGQRYHPEFDRAMNFLQRSVEERDREISEREESMRRRKNVKRATWMASVFAFLFLVSMAALVWAVRQTIESRMSRNEAIRQTNEAIKLARETVKLRDDAEIQRGEALSARTEAETQRNKADAARQEAEAEREKARKAQATAEYQRGIAQKQTALAIDLQEKAIETATLERQINTLTREVNDLLGEGKVDAVITKATEERDLHHKKGDPRGEFEAETILGSAYLQLKNSKEAQDAATRALKIQDENKIDNKRSRHENLVVLRDAYLQAADSVGGYTRSEENNKQHDLESLKLLTDAAGLGAVALDVQRQLSGAGIALIPDLTSMALINEKRKELVDAEANRQEIIAIQQETFRQSAVELVNYFSQLAAFDQTHGFYPQAKSQLEEALKIQESVFGPNDPQLVTTLNSLATLYRAMDLDSEAVIQRIQRLQGKEAVLRKGVSGPEVRTLQQNLQKLGFFQGPVDDYFGPSTEVAVISFQNSQGLVADGIVGPGTSELLQHPQKASAGMRDVQSKLKELGFYTGQLDGVSGMQTKAALMSFQRERGLSQSGNADSATLKALGFEVSGAGSSVTGKVSVEIVHQMFPNISVDNTKANLPGILRALQDAGLTDKDMVLMALSTIGIETAGTFAPTVERKSRFNTSVDGHPFDLYDNRLGNQGPPDGERFKGRGYVQITGRARYKEFGDNIGLDDQLIKNPDLASDPTVAAKIFAQYLKTIEGNLRPRLSKGDLAGARRAIAGPTQLAEFTKAYQTGASLIQ